MSPDHDQRGHYFALKGAPQDLLMFQEEPSSHSLPQIEQSAFINIDDELLNNNQNPLLITSMVGGNETMFDEDFHSGFINDILN
jgi:hypothetical protein